MADNVLVVKLNGVALELPKICLVKRRRILTAANVALLNYQASFFKKYRQM